MQTDIKEDLQIIGDIRQGGKKKREAIQFLLHEHQGMMKSVRSKFNLSNEAIKDIYADTLSTVIWNINTSIFKGQSKLSTYFYKILYNKSVDFLRHSTTNKNTATLELKEEDSETMSISPDRILESSLDVEKIKKEIAQLGDPCNSIIIDWGYWGYNMAEIAKRNKLESADKAKKKKYQCLKKLRSLLQAKGIE